MRFNTFLHNAGRAVAALACAANSLILAEENHWGTNNPSDIPYLVEDQSDGSSANGLVTYRMASDADFQTLTEISVLQSNYSSSVTLTTSDSPYHVTGNVVFEDWCVIEPGVEFVVEGDYEVRFKWVIEANGTEAEPILFRSLSGNRNAWKGLIIEAGVSAFDSRISHVHIHDATTGLHAARPAFPFSSLNIKNGTNGVIFQNSPIGTFKPILENSIIEDCTGWGVRMLSSHATVRDCEIKDCRSGGVYMQYSNGRVENSRLWQTGVNTGVGTGVFATSNPATSGSNVNNGTIYSPMLDGIEVYGFAYGVYYRQRMDGAIGAKIACVFQAFWLLPQSGESNSLSSHLPAFWLWSGFTQLDN